MRAPATLLVLGIFLLSAVFLAACGSDDNTPTNPGDTTAPTVVSTEPADGATDVALDQEIVVTCSEAMSPSVDNRAVHFSAGTVTSYQWRDDHTYVVGHTPFPDSTTVLVTAGHYLTDLAHNELEPKVWSFTTVHDTIPPEVESYTPGATQTEVDPNMDITIVFTESMDPTSAAGNIILNYGTVTQLNWTDSHTLVVQHDPWPLSTDIIVQVSGGVRDLAGNEMGHPSSWLFTTSATDATPPTVSSITPPSGSFIPTDTPSIRIDFSEPIDNFSMRWSEVNGQLWTHLPDNATMWGMDGRSVTILLKQPLPKGIHLHLVIDSYRDTAGNPNVDPITWDVTVAGIADHFPVDDTLVYDLAGQSTSDSGPVWDGHWYFHYREFSWDNAQDFRRFDLGMPSDTPTDWDYLRKTPTTLFFRGFREHDEEGGTDNDFMFDPIVEYMRLPIALGDSWSGTSTISTPQGAVNLNYNVEVFPGISQVPIPDAVLGKRASLVAQMQIFWTDCRTMRLYHDMVAGGDTLEVGVDTLSVVPGIGIVDERSYNHDYSDGSWSWDNDILFGIQPLPTKKD